jgi:hypothetical protein
VVAIVNLVKLIPRLIVNLHQVLQANGRCQHAPQVSSLILARDLLHEPLDRLTIALQQLL